MRRPWFNIQTSAALGAVLLIGTLVAAQLPAQSVQRLEDLSRAFRHAYQQVRPAVVLIATTRSWELPRFHPKMPDEDFRGLGSGTIVSADAAAVAPRAELRFAEFRRAGLRRARGAVGALPPCAPCDGGAAVLASQDSVSP